MSQEDLGTALNPFYVFSGAVCPDEYIEVQTALLNKMGPERYFLAQLNVIYYSITSLLTEISQKDDNSGVKINTNTIGNC